MLDKFRFCTCRASSMGYVCLQEHGLLQRKRHVPASAQGIVGLGTNDNYWNDRWNRTCCYLQPVYHKSLSEDD